jgi:hypothetical protein
MPDIKDDTLPFKTAAEVMNIGTDQGVVDPRLTQAPGLRDVPDSKVPGMSHSHVMGPGQAAVDPLAAGLDMGARPLSAAENRAITTADGITAPAPPDSFAEAAPGPSGGAGKPPEGTAQAPLVASHTVPDAAGSTDQPEPAALLPAPSAAQPGEAAEHAETGLDRIDTSAEPAPPVAV